MKGERKGTLVLSKADYGSPGAFVRNLTDRFQMVTSKSDIDRKLNGLVQETTTMLLMSNLDRLVFAAKNKSPASKT